MYHNIYKSTTRTPHHHLPSSIVEHSAAGGFLAPGASIGPAGFYFPVGIPWDEQRSQYVR